MGWEYEYETRNGKKFFASPYVMRDSSVDRKMTVQPIYARKLMKREILTVTFGMKGIRRLRVCLWVSKQLFRLASWISGFGTVKFGED